MICVSVAVSVAGIAIFLHDSDIQSQVNLPAEDVDEDTIDADVIMPVKVSRPGCEETDSCYIPSQITVRVGQSITWLNLDSAFHSVTSGTYDNPTDTFDSGYMDPYQTFTLTFDEGGTINYFCTLHPWMYGQVIVEGV